ncbi:MAG: TRAP-type mannitol/chloroaromatic compound transport system substrate-binding protein, partial [Flavobacteriales bacterium]
MKLLQLFVLSTFSILMISCGGQSSDAPNTQVEQQTYEWKLVTSWPKNFPGLGKGPETFAKYVERMSNGRL